MHETMVVILPPPIVSVQRPAWMRNTLLVAALASAGQEGAEEAVPGSTLLVQGLRAAEP